MSSPAFSAVRPSLRRPKLSKTISAYIARQFAVRFLTLFLAIAAIIMLVTTVDQLDRLATRGAPLLKVVEISFYKLPYLVQEVMPFSVLFAAMATFWRLTRMNELVVVRSAGVSVWQFLLPVVAVAMVIGAINISALNPLASVLLFKHEQLQSEYSSSSASTLAVSGSGLWLRQSEGDGNSVIHAKRVSEEAMRLHDVIIFRFESADEFTSRIDAKRAELEDGVWRLYEAWTTRPGEESKFVESMEVPTELTPEKIHNSFAPPETISFWSLPDFIALLEDAGFSANPHKLQFHRLLALPVLLAAMILIAATFSLRQHRQGGVALMVLSGVLAGFLIYVVSNVVFALGISGKIPVVLAAWTPAGASLVLGVTALLYMEDG